VDLGAGSRHIVVELDRATDPASSVDDEVGRLVDPPFARPQHVSSPQPGAAKRPRSEAVARPPGMARTASI